MRFRITSLRLRLVTCIALTSLLSIYPINASSAAPGPASEKGWQLRQRTGSHGGITVCITSRAVKMCGVAWAWGVLCKAPSWDAVCYSLGEKTICTVPYATWSKDGFTAVNLTDETDGPPSDCVERRFTYMGVSSVAKRWEGEAPRIGVMSEQQMGAKRCGYTLIAATVIETAPQARLLIRRLLELPDIAGVPLRFSASTQRENAMLSTLEIKQTQFGADVFAVPRGFKVLKSYSQVFINDQDRKDINDASEILSPLK